MTIYQRQHWRHVFSLAKAAAQQAVADYLAPYDGKEPNHLECGFAWVTIRPATHSFVRWLQKEAKAMGGQSNSVARTTYGSRGYYGGWQLWNPSGWGGQWMPAKIAGAAAFARVLNENGVPASVESRLD